MTLTRPFSPNLSCWSQWKKESSKHKPQISLIETENKFELMETESQESPSKQRNPKSPKASKSGRKT